MPTYVYECAKCGDEFELWQSFSDDPLKRHPGCGGKVAKVLQPVGIVLKGSGFYKNDSRSGRSGGARREKGESASSEGSTSGSKAETKSESKSEGKPAGKSESKSDSKAAAGSGSGA